MRLWRLLFACISLLIFFALVSRYATQQVRAGTDPVAYWKFDDGSGTTPIDSSGNNITGSFLTPNPTWSTDVPPVSFSDPYSLDFTNYHDGVTFSWPSGLNFSSNASRSFSFWYKPTANGEADSGSYDRVISWDSDAFEIAGTLGDVSVHEIAFYDGSWRDTGYALTVGTWYHITFTYDGTYAKFYVGDVKKYEGAEGGRDLSGTMAIGTRQNGHNEGINGIIDDVRVYDYALDITQIENLTAGSSSPDAPPPTATPTPAPTATPTPTSAVTPTPTPVPSKNSSSCTAQAPSNSPDLFQVSTSPTAATLYFTPVSPVNSYTISYGTSTEADQYSTSFNTSNSSGVVTFTINNLQESTTYYFKAQGKNDCMPGSWSQVAQGVTTRTHPVTSTTHAIPIPTPKPVGKIIVTDKTQSSKPLPTPTKTVALSPTPAAGYTLAITVKNNGQPVPNAVVELHSVPQRTVTDKDGIARFNNVEQGDHTVSLVYQGYQGQEKIKLSGEDKDVAINLNVQLTPSPTAMLSWWLVGGLGIVVLVLCVFIFFLLKKRRKHAGLKENLV